MASSSLSVSITNPTGTKPKWTSSIFGTYPVSSMSVSQPSINPPSDYLSSFIKYKRLHQNNNNNDNYENNNEQHFQNNSQSHRTRSNNNVLMMKSKPKITEHEFIAHGSAVTCLALGQKSGRVMVTGGDDAKINLWAIGKSNCIMSLNCHRTSIECAKFNQNEDIVGAGSASGAIKLWDLEAAKLIQTLTGHKTNVRCIDFHPYGHFLASGSFDTSIKLWDYRKKSCIITYKIHSKDVHCLKLSPDGRWLASGGNEGSVMLYDIVAGKMLAELKNHSSPVTDVVFHPNEFLLASSSSDGTVKFWDLESFIQVSTTTYNSDIGAIRKIAFYPDGKALISAGKDMMKIYGWEPTQLYDASTTNWGKLNDMAVLDEQIIAGTFSATNVSVYMIDLNMFQPFTKSIICTRDNVLRQSTRRSFNFDQTSKTCKQLESLESNRTDDIDTNGSDGVDSLAEIYNACDYKEIFQSRRELTRTPPPIDNSNLSNDQNLRILQQAAVDTSLLSPSTYSKTIKTNALPRSLANSNSSIPLHSVRHLSESLNNLNLNHRNNLPNHAMSSIVTNHNNNINNNNNNNEHLNIKETNLTNNNNILTHSTSLTGLNQLKTLDPHVTFPTISSANNKLNGSSTNTDPMYPYNSTSATLSSFGQAPIPPSIYSQSNTATNEKSTNNFLPTSMTPNKITSVVRPVINDMNRPSITAYPVMPQQQQQQTKSVSSNDQTMKSSIVQISPSLVTANSNSNSNNHNDTSLIIPEIRDHPAGLDFNDFLPKHIQQYGQQSFISEIETINTIMKGHKAAKAGLDYRRKQVQIVLAMWTTKDSKTALEYAINLDEKSIIIDILNVMIWKPSTWNLDIALILLPCIQELLQSKYESYMSVGCSALSLILKTFSSTIKNNISAPPGIGVDISREERYNKCMRCYNLLLSARAFVLKRQTLQGKIGRSFRELSILMQNLE